MKSFKVLFLVIVSGILVSLSGCNKPDPTPPTPEEEQLEKLSQTWKIKKVTLDNVDKTTTADYQNFSLSISGTPGASSFLYTTIRAVGSTTPWPGNGSWAFGTDPLSDINRDTGADLVAMKYSVTGDQLQISFKYTGVGYIAGRTSNVKGEWIFTFTL